MHVRQTDIADGDAVRDLVERSMLASYSLGPGTIEAAIEEWFGSTALEAKLADDERALLVAERDATILGVVDAAYVPETGTGDVLWLHVDPDYRGEGVGRRLFEAATGWLADAGADNLRGLVLANNADGNAFYRELGFEHVGQRDVEIDGTPYTEHVYHGDGRERVTVLQDDGREVYVDLEDARRGSLGPFFTVYADADATERYGFQCGNCETLATAMAAMGHVECSECGNTRKPTRWDAAWG